ncbi:hypothetical protein GE061_002535 [Apolygus lucorum]|uniref:Uncharacterized protein n=1 Tax=Apolygus lucorum TaxID=248454 RepID=A0A8S9X9E5_APOLU|nr:hypothetical protein GE061_002535 [Apolygus lucorum]
MTVRLQPRMRKEPKLLYLQRLRQYIQRMPQQHRSSQRLLRKIKNHYQKQRGMVQFNLHTKTNKSKLMNNQQFLKVNQMNQFLQHSYQNLLVQKYQSQLPKK